MTTEGKAIEEARLRELLDDWVKALRGKAINGLMSHYASDILVFGITPPLQYRGPGAHREHWEQMFASFEGPIGYEIHDLSITTVDDVAISHSLNRISGKMKDEKEGGTWIRVTACSRKIDGKWLVTHEHVSVPFDPESGKASLDLEP